MRRFLREGIEGAEVAPQVDKCPLCRTWAAYVQGLSRANGGQSVVSFDREQAHSMLTAGYWAGVHKGSTELCETHAHHVSILDTMNADTEPPKDS